MEEGDALENLAEDGSDISFLEGMCFFLDEFF